MEKIRQLRNKIVSFDAEYRNSEERYLTPVSAVLYFKRGKYKSYWLFNNPEEVKRFKSDFSYLVQRGRYIACYQAGAETRFLMALGFDAVFIQKVKWLDVYPLWCMLNHNLGSCQYGKYFYLDGGEYKQVQSRPPKNIFEEDGHFYYDNDGNPVWVDNPLTRRYSKSLVDSTACLLGVNLNSVEKDQMRSKILLNESFNDEDKEAILAYNLSDVVYLKPLLYKASKLLSEYLHPDFKFDYILGFSRWTAVNGVIENEGIPVDLEKMEQFSENYEELEREVIKDCNKVYKFFEYDRSKKKWVRKQQLIADYIDSLGIDWPKTDKGAYRTDDDTLARFDNLRPIFNLRKTVSTLKSIGRFKPSHFSSILRNVGLDRRVRIGTLPFASITSRNQPKIKDGWVFGMSTFIRTLIKAPEGYEIIAADYASQELAVQALLSGDKQFVEAYKSNDLYLWFAKRAGSVPENVERQGGIYVVDGVPVSDELQNRYKMLRNLFKGVVLGVGYGMGLQSLSNHLNKSIESSVPKEIEKAIKQNTVAPNKELQAEIDGFFSDLKIYAPRGYYDRKDPKYDRFYEKLPQRQKADFYKKAHTEQFKSYWLWRTTQEVAYQRRKYIMLPDGWSIINDGQHNKRTVGNFRVQGTAGVILREAVYKCLERGLKVFATLHDAIYILSDNVQRDKPVLTECMLEASREVLGQYLVRVDADVYTTDWVNFRSKWTADKGFDDLERFGKYFFKKKG